MRKYEKVVEEGRGPKDLSPRVPRSKGPRVPRIHGPRVQRTKISQSQIQLRAWLWRRSILLYLLISATFGPMFDLVFPPNMFLYKISILGNLFFVLTLFCCDYDPMSVCKCVFDIQNIMSTICSEISSIVSLFMSHPAQQHTFPFSSFT